jgi:hypothetical protein
MPFGSLEIYEKEDFYNTLTLLILKNPSISVWVFKIEDENQSRWLLVEEAWRNKLSPNMLEYHNGEFISINKSNERVNLRSAVNVLLPYQHGNCFYCNKKIPK